MFVNSLLYIPYVPPYLDRESNETFRLPALHTSFANRRSLLKLLWLKFSQNRVFTRELIETNFDKLVDKN